MTDSDKNGHIAASFGNLDIQGEMPTNGIHEPAPIPPEQIKGIRSKAKPLDITAKFIQATAALPTGDLVKDDFFTLFEAVGALEIMDPKMDSGYLNPGDTLEDDYDILQRLSAEQIIWIMDSMLCSEVGWHFGHPLSQTLFTSIYIERLLWPEPKTLDDSTFHRKKDAASTSDPLLHLVLRAHCLALIKTCDFVHRKISSETFYEEEDFVTNLYNRPLLTCAEVSDIYPLLDEAIAFIDQNSISLAKSIRDALLARLELRRLLLVATAFDIASDEQGQASCWKLCLNRLPALKSSRGLGISMESSISTKIQRRLASSVPPRPIVKTEFNDAYEFLERLFQDGIEVEDVLSCPTGSNIFTFLDIFQSRKQQPCVYMRCLLQSLIFSKTQLPSPEGAKTVLFEDLRELVLPSDQALDEANDEVEAPMDDRFQIARRMETFVNHMRNPYYDYIRALTMNRSRTRRMLCRIMVDWDNLQLDLEDLDTELRQYTYEKPVVDEGVEIWSFALSSWAYNLKLTQMELVVQLGFELQIYQIDEIPSMYWYLRYLSTIRYKHLERILLFTQHRLSSSIISPSPSEQEEIEHSFNVLTHSMNLTSATATFSEALSCLYYALQLLDLLPQRNDSPYSEPAFRHALRMRPFLPISIPTVPPANFFPDELSSILPSNLLKSPSSTKKYIATALLKRADDCILAARGTWDAVSKADANTAQCVGCEVKWRARMKNILRSVIAAGISVAGVKKWVHDGMKNGEVKIEVLIGDKTYHEWWVIPKVIKQRGEKPLKK